VSFGRIFELDSGLRRNDGESVSLGLEMRPTIGMRKSQAYG
jgi:hypothetical protein